MNNSYFIMGRHCLSDLFQVEPERFIKVFAAHSKKGDPLFSEMEMRGIPVHWVSKLRLDTLVASSSHQLCIALVRKKEDLSLKEFLSILRDKENACLLMLDSIFDPHNFGAILRAAECLGADGIIWSKNRGSPITPVVSKTSSGASELVRKILVSNLTEAAKACKNEGFEIVIADLDQNAKSLFSFAFPKKMLLIMGSEGKGIQPLIKRQADHIVKIPLSGKIESLNVSQAAAIILSFYSFKLSSNP